MKQTNSLIEETLNSIDNIQRASPGTHFAEKVWKRVQLQKQTYISQTRLLKAAALIALWIGVNIFTFVHFQHRAANKQGTTSQALLQAYFSNDTQLINIIE